MKFKYCHRHIVYPRADGGWVFWYCLYEKGHEGVHWGYNYAPFLPEQDVAFLWEQFKMFVEVWGDSE